MGEGKDQDPPCDADQKSGLPLTPTQPEADHEIKMQVFQVKPGTTSLHELKDNDNCNPLVDVAPVQWEGDSFPPQT